MLRRSKSAGKELGCVEPRVSGDSVGSDADLLSVREAVECDVGVHGAAGRELWVPEGPAQHRSRWRDLGALKLLADLLPVDQRKAVALEKDRGRQVELGTLPSKLEHLQISELQAQITASRT